MVQAIDLFDNISSKVKLSQRDEPIQIVNWFYEIICEIQYSQLR